MKKNKDKIKAYIVGGGIAALATAVYLIRDGHIPGKYIYILEKSKVLGGSLDRTKISDEQGFVSRGFRMFEEKAYTCSYELLSQIPSFDTPGKTIKDVLTEFNEENSTYSKVRLIKEGKAINARPLKLALRDRFALLRLITRPEASLEYLSLEDYFSPSFFKSNCFYESGTTFSFQPWSSLLEYKRYLLRFLHDIEYLNTLETVKHTKYNQYESIVLPIVRWLKKHEVNFVMQTNVVDLDFSPEKDKKIVTSIKYLKEGKKDSIIVNEGDLVFATLGSMVSDSSLGSTTTAPKPPQEPSNSWDLWKNISKKYSDLGNPATFCENIEKTKWVSFTMMNRDSTFLELMKKLTKRKIGSGGHITITDSNWLITFGVTKQPHFKEQPESSIISWGYGLFPNEKGNYVKKKMAECTGEEIMVELLSHLRFNSQMKSIIENSTCIPCLMPYITSQFLPRAKKDRPLVVPNGSVNLGLIGQYSEMPEGIVFTVETSIRSAQIAVYTLLNLDKKLTPFYKGRYNPKVLYNVFKTAFR